MIHTLQREHLTTTELLDLLEREYLILKLGGQVKYELVDLIITYFASFPNKVHHQKEDLIYRRLKLRIPAAFDELVGLEKEHELLNELQELLCFPKGQIRREWESGRESAMTGVERYIEFSRAHMEKEEQKFLPLASKELQSDDWAAISRSIASLMQSNDYRESVSKGKTLYHWIKAVDTRHVSKTIH